MTAVELGLWTQLVLAALTALGALVAPAKPRSTDGFGVERVIWLGWR